MLSSVMTYGRKTVYCESSTIMTWMLPVFTPVPLAANSTAEARSQPWLLLYTCYSQKEIDFGWRFLVSLYLKGEIQDLTPWIVKAYL